MTAQPPPNGSRIHNSLPHTPLPSLETSYLSISCPTVPRQSPPVLAAGAYTMETDHRLPPAHYPILPADCSLHSSSSQEHRQTYPCSSAAPTSDAYQRQPFGSNTEPASHVEDSPSTQRKRRRLVNQPIRTLADSLLPVPRRLQRGLVECSSIFCIRCCLAK